MTLSPHIAGLLYEHDCVIIPGLGGLVCNPASAQHVKGRHLFQPPYKKISFNRNLKVNDGLLAHGIASSLGISYSDACVLIQSEVADILKSLEAGHPVVMEKIGTLHPGSEGTIHFEQDIDHNYLIESFGLTAFHVSPIRREPIERKVERQLRDRVAPAEPVTGTRRVVRRGRVVLAAAATILLLAIGFLGMNQDWVRQTQMAGLNPFYEHPDPLYQPDPQPNPDNDVAKDDLRSLLAAHAGKDTSRYLKIFINGSIPIVVSLDDEKHPPPAAPVRMNRKTGAGNYHIIGGAFSVQANAEKFVAHLRSLGFDAQIIDRKLHMVSYGSFATREQAMQALEKIRATQSDAWLMKI